MNKRWINTKVEFIWDGSQYVEQSSDGYWYDGEMALCYTVTNNPWSSQYSVGIGTESPESFAAFAVRRGVTVNSVSVSLSTSDAAISTFDVRHKSGLVDLSAQGSALTLSAGAAERVKILADGKVGIGTSSPTELLHIKNSSNSWNEYSKIRIGTETSDLYACEIGFHRGTNSDADRGFFIDGGGAGTQHLKVLHTGKVGIGTTAPSRLLTVSSTTGQADLTIRSADDSWSQLMFGDQSADNVAGVLYDNSSSKLHLNTSTTGSGGIRLTIDNSGNIGIGTTSPDTLFHMESGTSGGNCRLKLEDTNADDNSPMIQFVKDSASPAVWDYLGAMYFYGDDNQPAVHTYAGITVQSSNVTNGSEEGLMNLMTSVAGTLTNVLTIKGGNVGIGDTSPSYKLEVAGTFYASGSSQAFKKNVTDLAIDSSAIYNLNPVSYNYKKDYENFGYDLAEGKQFGLISEQVAEAVPELAIMKDGEPKNVDYQKLSVLLLAEMQKMNKRIKDLECHI